MVDVANPDGRLLPGMTATVDFLVETATDVLYVSNAALRYRPDQETMTAAFDKMRSEMEARRSASADEATDTTAGAGSRPSSGMPGNSGQGAAAANRGMLWTVRDDGELAVIPVRTGISDGTHTAVMGRRLEVGQQVIAGVSSSAASTSSSSSPFQQQQSGGRRPGPPAPGGF